MLKPRPLSPFTSSITTGSLLHIAKLLSGSSDLDLVLEVKPLCDGGISEEFGGATFSGVSLRICSDFALIKRSFGETGGDMFEMTSLFMF